MQTAFESWTMEEYLHTFATYSNSPFFLIGMADSVNLGLAKAANFSPQCMVRKVFLMVMTYVKLCSGPKAEENLNKCIPGTIS